MRIFTGIFIVILIILTGCSNKSSLELINSTVDIRDDRTGEIEITAGEMEGEFIKPIALSYDFVLKNIGTKTVGGTEKPNSQTFTYDDGIELIIEPKDKLITIIEEIMGVNIFTEEGRAQAYLGVSKTGTPILQPKQEGKYTFDFELGAPKENPEMRIVPTQDEIDELVKNAMEVTLVIYVEEEEIARFDLK
ncbi:hypothetical protein ACJ2A9_16980 [Anaerobacillus sp. MEB173]|uniref:hypothetical protein n=1 Tax=Anaerobacillus sp. MEB173 TaxID=3383345 RepID=UPI003F931ADD